MRVSTSSEYSKISKSSVKFALMDVRIYVQESLKFSGPEGLYDYDVILWEPEHILATYEFSKVHHDSLIDKPRKKFLDDQKRRAKDFESFFSAGGLLVVISPPPSTFVPTLHLNINIPVEGMIPGMAPLQPGSGKLISFKGPDYLRTFWQSQKENFIYRGYFENPPGRPFLFTRNTEQSLAYTTTSGKGHILVLPALNFKIDPRDQDSHARLGSLIESLEQYYRQVKGEKTPPPNWVTKIQLPGEIAIGKTVESTIAEISKLETRLQEEKLLLSAFEDQKVLLFGKSDDLTLQVSKALTELGFVVKEGAQGRDDLVLQYGEETAVVEVTGTKNSASEKKSAQLEKWVSREITENDIHPKPLLIVNAYCEIEPSKRTEDAFPSQMLKHSKAREHCLVTTSQLLMMLLKVRNGSMAREQVVDILFSTIGPVLGFEYSLDSESKDPDTHSPINQ